MKKAKIAELRNGLSRYLDHVRAGGTVLVYDRDKPIAEIVPLTRSKTCRPCWTSEKAAGEILGRVGIGSDFHRRKLDARSSELASSRSAHHDMDYDAG